MNRNMEQKKIKRDFEKLITELKKKDGFIHQQVKHNDSTMHVGYLKTSVDPEKLQKFILPRVQDYVYNDLAQLENHMPIAKTELLDDASKVQEKLVEGYLFIHMEGSIPAYLLIPVPLDQKRQVSTPEVEFSVVGPKEAFVEDIDTNLNLIRNVWLSPNCISKTSGWHCDKNGSCCRLH